MGYGVDAPRQAADDGYAGAGQVIGQPVGRLTPVRAGLSGADHGNGALVFWRQPASHVEDGREIVDLL